MWIFGKPDLASISTMPSLRVVAEYLLRVLFVLVSAYIGHVIAIASIGNQPFEKFTYSRIFDILGALANGSCSVLGIVLFLQTVVSCLLIAFKRVPIYWFLFPGLFFFSHVFVWIGFCVSGKGLEWTLPVIIAPFIGQFILCILVMEKQTKPKRDDLPSEPG
ncbi:MAG: hypothetical protein JST89_03050 [Cyanobacteria bacterium SZAS-4]|nr:hypothetical protein [Cyanobacteria bacterium SZAS-4]